MQTCSLSKHLSNRSSMFRPVRNRSSLFSSHSVSISPSGIPTETEPQAQFRTHQIRRIAKDCIGIFKTMTLIPEYERMPTVSSKCSARPSRCSFFLYLFIYISSPFISQGHMNYTVDAAPPSFPLCAELPFISHLRKCLDAH